MNETNQIALKTNAEFVNKVIQEYIDCSETMLVQTNNFYTYIPNVFDMVNALPGVPWEDAMLPIMDVIMENHIFCKFQNRYFYVPIKEVW